MTATTECSSCSTLAFPLLPRDSCIVSRGLLLLPCLLEVELCLPTSIMLGSSLKRSREDDFEDELFAHEPKVRPSFTWNVTFCSVNAAAALSRWTLLNYPHSVSEVRFLLANGPWGSPRVRD